uniref:Nodule cysteine-rich protein 11 n=1 Tax=Cicer arietinum TaxID=3827 RepID=A0A0U8TNL3_CICAR|nr:TPA_exp: nodule cysteine-rich protein 11 [Cicer arietinum]
MVGIVKFVCVMVFFFFLFNIGMNLVEAHPRYPCTKDEDCPKDMCKYPGSYPRCVWGWCECFVKMRPLRRPIKRKQLQ